MNDLKQKMFAVLLVLSIILISVPVVSAKEDCSYSVRPSVHKEPFVSVKLSDTITQSETNRHQMYIGNEVKYFEMYLNWQSDSDSLALTVYTPSWTNIGNFHDSDDGILDGKIHIDIVPNGNYVDQGTWTFDVYGESVSSQRSYTFSIISH